MLSESGVVDVVVSKLHGVNVSVRVGHGLSLVDRRGGENVGGRGGDVGRRGGEDMRSQELRRHL